MKKQKSYKYNNQPFDVVCTMCVEKSIKNKIPYNGIVNWHIIVKSPYEITIYYHCYTCKVNWEQKISGVDPKHAGKPKNKEDLLRRVNASEKEIN